MGPGPGCNLIPPLASTGTKVDISQFPPPDSLTDPELAGPVSCCAQVVRLPIESLTGVNVPSGSPRGTVTLPLFQGRGADAIPPESPRGIHYSMQATS